MSNIRPSTSSGSNAPAPTNQQGPAPNARGHNASGGGGGGGAPPINSRLLQRMGMVPNQNQGVAPHVAAQQYRHQQQRQPPHHQGPRGQQHGGQQRGGPPARPGGATTPLSPQHQHPRQRPLHPPPQHQQQQKPPPRLPGMMMGGPEALRTLALMKSLGVSAGATALAAAVLPNTALPKTAAAVTAAARAAVRPTAGGAAVAYHQQQPQPHVRSPNFRPGGASAVAAAGGGSVAGPAAFRKDCGPGGEPGDRSSVLRTYGEENPLFYERLVQLVGKKDADEMVREAVDETIKEETEGGGEGNNNNNNNNSNNNKTADIISIADSSSEEEEEGEEKEKEGEGEKPAARSDAGPVPRTVSVAVGAEAQLSEPSTLVPHPKAASAANSVVRDSKKRGAELVGGPTPPPAKRAATGGPKKSPPRKYSHALPIPLLGPKDDKLLRSLFGRLPSSSAAAVLTPGLDGIPNSAGAAARASAGGKKEDKDPPGFDQFKADPKFCMLLFECAKKWKKAMAAKNLKNIGGLFVHGLLCIKDEELLNSLSDSDPSIRAYVEQVITPYLNVPANLTKSEGHWEAYIHISSENINEFARAIVYQRRRAMKSAVRFALYEIGKNRPELLNMARAQKNKEQNSKLPASMAEEKKKVADEKKKVADEKKKETEAKKKEADEKKKETEKDDLIKKLEAELAAAKEKHAEEIKSWEEKHMKETKQNEDKYTSFVSKLIKSHRKEMNMVKREMKDMQNVHKTFLDSYVEASVDVLRSGCGSPEL